MIGRSGSAGRISNAATNSAASAASARRSIHPHREYRPKLARLILRVTL
ncbi:hypothetical protein ACFQX6_03775 [Streptosporangium lutulentum]